jgi:hypothetical protein
MGICGIHQIIFSIADLGSWVRSWVSNDILKGLYRYIGTGVYQ